MNEEQDNIPKQYREATLIQKLPNGDSLGVLTRINYDQLPKKFHAFLGQIDKCNKFMEIVDKATKDNPLNNGLPF